MTNRDLYVLLEGLIKAKSFKGSKFSFFVVKNIKLIEEELNLIKDAFKPSEGYSEFLRKKQELIDKFSVKDELGNIKKRINEFNQEVVDFGEKEDEVSSAFSEVIVEHKSDLEEYAREENEILNSESSITLIRIKSSDIPDEVSGDILESFIDLVD